MQVRTVFLQMHEVPWHHFAYAIGLTVAVVVATRFIWVYPAAWLPRWFVPSLARRDPVPPWRWLFFLGFVGVRGVVSLAAALAIPLFTASGAPFPDRDLILFVTFGVIVVTLIGQGLMLPALVRWLRLNAHAADERRREHEAELAARAQALNVGHERLQQVVADGRISPEALAVLRARHEYRAGRLPTNAPDDGDAAALAADIRMELIAAEREFIYKLLQDGAITDEARRRIERELDLEEASIACKKEGGEEPPL
jgi:monovalent cation/hydrogen antiporter